MKRLGFLLRFPLPEGPILYSSQSLSSIAPSTSVKKTITEKKQVSAQKATLCCHPSADLYLTISAHFEFGLPFFHYGFDYFNNVFWVSHSGVDLHNPVMVCFVICLLVITTCYCQVSPVLFNLLNVFFNLLTYPTYYCLSHVSLYISKKVMKSV